VIIPILGGQRCNYDLRGYDDDESPEKNCSQCVAPVPETMNRDNNDDSTVTVQAVQALTMDLLTFKRFLIIQAYNDGAGGTLHVLSLQGSLAEHPSG